MFKRLTILLLLTVTTVVTASAQTTAEKAKELFDDGIYEEALPLLKALNEADPKNGRIAYMLGVSMMETGDNGDAAQLIERGVKAGIPEASLALAEWSVRRYEVDAADESIEKYRRHFTGKRSKNAPKIDSESLNELESRIERTRNMLSRVEKIAVIDSMVVDASTFFNAYQLSPESGSLHSSEALPAGTAAADPTVVYTPQSGGMMMWSAPGADGTFTLMSASKLADGSWEQPHSLGTEINEGGDANYPFMMADGMTLYFANDGENSLGGYDIFITRNDGDKYLQPQNIGMPYNSPYDDYMLAIDETTGLGWWATDRNRIPGKVTIYIFVPSDTRVNYPDDTPGLASLARLSSIRDTQEEGAAYPMIMRRADNRTNSRADRGPTFSFAMPGGMTYTSLSDFKSQGAREAMGQYLHAKAEAEATGNELSELRQRYAEGDHSVSETILTLERRLLSQSEESRRLANEVIRIETGR